MKNKKYFTVDDHDELVDDSVFSYHLKKRNKLIEKLNMLEKESFKRVSDFKDRVKTYLAKIKYKDKYLREFIRGRLIYGIHMSSDTKDGRKMRRYGPFKKRKLDRRKIDRVMKRIQLARYKK